MADPIDHTEQIFQLTARTEALKQRVRELEAEKNQLYEEREELERELRELKAEKEAMCEERRRRRSEQEEVGLQALEKRSDT